MYTLYQLINSHVLISSFKTDEPQVASLLEQVYIYWVNSLGLV